MLVLKRKRNEVLSIGDNLLLMPYKEMDHGKHENKLKVAIYDKKNTHKVTRYLSYKEPIEMAIGGENVLVSYLGNKGQQYSFGITAPFHIGIMRDDSKESKVLFKEDTVREKKDTLVEHYKEAFSWFF